MSVTTVPYQTLVPAGTWRVDAAHSSVGFSVKHLGLARVRGWFSAFEGELRVEPGSGDLAAEGSVQVASLDTRHEQRDAHLRSPAFFDAARHPRITFQVTGVDGLGDSRFRVYGDLTIRGKRRPVVLVAEVVGTGVDAHGRDVVAIEARGAIDRREFGMSFDEVAPAGNALVSDEVRLELDLSAVRTA